MLFLLVAFFFSCTLACDCLPPVISICSVTGTKYVFKQYALDQSTFENNFLRYLVLDSSTSELDVATFKEEPCPPGVPFTRCESCPEWFPEEEGVELKPGQYDPSAAPAKRLGDELPTIKKDPGYWGADFFFINERNGTAKPNSTTAGFMPGQRCCGADPPYIDYPGRLTIGYDAQWVYLMKFDSWPPAITKFLFLTDELPSAGQDATIGPLSEQQSSTSADPSINQDTTAQQIGGGGQSSTTESENSTTESENDEDENGAVAIVPVFLSFGVTLTLLFQ